jgi:hypothetical protein
MTLSMYQASVPVFTRMLANLASCLTKAEADATTRGIATDVFMAARLAPDMLPLPRQVQIACDSAKRGIANLAGIEAPVFPDTETTFPELQDRIAKTQAFLATVDAAKIDGTEDRDITLKMPSREVHFKGQPFLMFFTLPNFFFHLTSAYAILRHNGVALGKMDYLGSV